MDDVSNKLNGIQLEMAGEYAKFTEKFKPKKKRLTTAIRRQIFMRP